MDFIPNLLSPAFLDRIDHDWAGDYGFVALARLIGRDWFSRLWVVQEVAYGKDIVLLCGNREVHWADFLDAIGLVKFKLESIKTSFRSSPILRHHSTPLNNFNSSGAIALLDILRKVFLKSSDGSILGRQIGLETLVSDAAMFQTQVPHDTIYALLRLAKDPELVIDLPAPSIAATSALSPLKIDYDRSILDTYSDFISHCIRTSGSIDIIRRPWAPVKRSNRHESFLGPDLRDPDLRFKVPSWIAVRDELPYGDPKSESHDRLCADSLVGSAASKIYNANNDVPARVRFGMTEVDRSYDGSILAKGIELGTITEVSTRMADGIVLKECLAMIGGIISDDSGKLNTVSDTLWRVLCANRDENGKSVPHLYRIALIHLLQKIPKLTSIDTTELLDTGQPDHIAEFLKRVQAVIWNRRVVIARRDNLRGEKLLGLGPKDVQVGDKICILFGGSVPFVLRQHHETAERCWELVGEAYVEENMDGEALIGLQQDQIEAMQTEFAIW